MGPKFLAVLVVSFALVAVVKSSILRRRAGFTNISNFADDSCAGRCNRTGTVPGAPCQCNSACIRYNDCCSDYYSLCLGQTGSCAGRCDQVGTTPGTCQCNKPCVDHGDCCPDYSDVCKPSEGISDKDLEDIAEKLLSLDTVNNASLHIRVNLQGQGGSGDRAPEPLLTVAPAAFTRPSIQKLTALHDNYIPETNVRESYTAAEEQEMSAFIDEIFSTPVMQAAQEFLVSKNLPNGKSKFYEMWFELYTRGNGVISSCGFEHVFVGELNSGVSGFHNWEYFAKQEEIETVNYLSYAEYVDMGSKGSVLEFSFSWHNKVKPVSSIFIGTSPEMELAVYTVCFLARPNSKCPISLDGNKIKIQTYTIGSNSQYVATSYPDLSD